MSTVDIDRLRRLLGGDETRWLIERVRGRLARGRAVAGSVSLAGATTAQRRAVEVLLGRPPGSGRSLTVSLDDLDAVIRRGGVHSDGLGAAVVALTGPVVVLADAQAELEAEWTAALAPLARVAVEQPALATWYALPSTRGLARRVCGTPGAAVPVVASAAALLARLPLTGVPLSQVARRGRRRRARPRPRPSASRRSSARQSGTPGSPHRRMIFRRLSCAGRNGLRGHRRR